MTREEMLNKMDSIELQEWYIFHKYYPIGDDRGDIQAGTVSASIVSALSGKKQKITDYIPKYKKTTKKRQTNEQMLTIAKALNSVFGGDFIGTD